MTTSAGDTDLRFADLSLDRDGKPHQPLTVVDVDGLRHSSRGHIADVAASIAAAAALTVAVVGDTVPARLHPILDAATVAVSESPHRDRRVVTVTDRTAAVEILAAAVDHAPRAALACGHLLRRTPALPTLPALAAEAAVYSMLLGGTEFRAWLAARGPARVPDGESGELVRIDRSGGELAIVLNRPRRRNALSAGLREGLLAAAQVAEADPTITSVRLAGAGPAFCSGGDLDEFGCATDPVAAYLVRLDRAPWRVLDRLSARLRIDTHGACVGAGAEIAAFGGIVTAAPGTWFRFPEVGMGLVPGAGGTVSVPRRIGRWRAAWAMLTGATIDVDTALRWGLVDRIEPTGGPS
ncbi:enoyl-CoA hydratase/isomerase family protein [Nocardia mikamii]|uniref:enoyl-CoA hydratase/isomerase family protein n=1 Tax=Nocardia mikamii TaxID=508464 RepID=UPI0007A423C5|nr:enoyl-CoA hydratase/isomerase family protein [Nocardia mikamii]